MVSLIDGDTCSQHFHTNFTAETTAHSIAATLGFLSIFDELQEEIYQQIISVVGHEREPVGTFYFHSQYRAEGALQMYDDYPKLNKVLAAFFEALRMFRAHHSLLLAPDL